MILNSLNDLLIEQVKDLYDAEHRMTKALPKMAAAASSGELKSAFTEHLEETRRHVTRLEEVFAKLGVPPERETCEATRGLIEEGEEVLQAFGDAKVKDAALIASAQRVEHYEIAGYGSARALARQVGESDVADLLGTTLDEESAADSKLTTIAEGGWFTAGINDEAVKG